MSNPVDKTQVQKAVKALLMFLKKRQAAMEEEKPSLFNEEEQVYVCFQLKKMPEKPSTRKIAMYGCTSLRLTAGRLMTVFSKIPHTIYGREGMEVCLITKDPQKDFKAKLAAEPVECVSKIIGVSKLREKHGQYKDKRDLVSSYDLFLADDRVIPLLPPLLGKAFFKRKKHPYPVNIRSKFAQPLQQARDSTFLTIGGAYCQIVAGTSTFSVDHLTDNAMAVIEAAAVKFPKKWKNIQGVFLKTADSVALPVYNSLPSEKPVAAPEAKTDEKAETKSNDEAKTQKKKQTGKGKRKAKAEDTPPAKKAKSTPAKAITKAKAAKAKAAKTQAETAPASDENEQQQKPTRAKRTRKAVKSAADDTPKKAPTTRSRKKTKK